MQAPRPDDVAVLVQRLDERLTGPRPVDDLRRYFGIGLRPGQEAFSGARFEHLGGGGESAGTADTVTATDLVAVETLSVRIPVELKLGLLEGPVGERLSALLREVPSGVDLVDAPAQAVADGSPAARAWELLTEQRGVGWVTAGKTLARKRPRLLPVYDTVVRCALGRPPSFWSTLRAALGHSDGALHHRLLELREAAGLPDTVSALRVCDVAVWMGHRTDEHACPR
ncbi:DUF6308 family protein [Streptomyces sp. NPDC006984]|uniref:DUF6308 family protein n=1 Tax=Streptomyces sp. NPDC006984 TaxID=3155463 RepID=UPI003401C090